MITRLRRHLAHAAPPESLAPALRRARSAWEAYGPELAPARDLVAAWLRSLRPVLALLAAWLRAVRAATATVASGAREALVMVVAYGLYTLVRGLWGGTLAEGRESAAGVIDAERALGIYVEEPLQDLFLRHHLGMPFWNTLYVASQVVVLPLTVLLVFRYRRGAYAFVRNLVLLSWSAGLVWYALQPVAPPRLLEGGFMDTVSEQTFFNLNSDVVEAFYNPVAAMPSLHVGMSPIVAWALVRLTPWLWTRALGLAYPALVTVCVVVTGNHFLLDVAGGLAVVLPAAALAWILARPPAPRRLPAPAPARPRVRVG